MTIQFNEHIIKTISTKPVEFVSDGEKIKMSADRCRTSNGDAVITVRLGEQSIRFDNALLGTEYEQIAFEFATMLESIAKDSCSLR